MRTDASADRVREALRYDPVTGEFNRTNPYKKRDPTGTVCDQGYLIIKVDGIRYKAHRLAWLYVHGQWPALPLDHIDGNRQNNAIGNLREATATVNRNNVRKARKDSKTGLMGVTFDKKKKLFRAVLQLPSRTRLFSPYSSDPTVCHSWYVQQKRQHSEGFQL